MVRRITTRISREKLYKKKFELHKTVMEKGNRSLKNTFNKKSLINILILMMYEKNILNMKE